MKNLYSINYYIIYFLHSIYTATWNVNGRPCADTSLKAWLSATEEPPDIYAIAFQELDLSPKAITFSESRPDPVWMYGYYCAHLNAIEYDFFSF